MLGWRRRRTQEEGARRKWRFAKTAAVVGPLPHRLRIHLLLSSDPTKMAAPCRHLLLNAGSDRPVPPVANDPFCAILRGYSCEPTFVRTAFISASYTSVNPPAPASAGTAHGGTKVTERSLPGDGLQLQLMGVSRSTVLSLLLGMSTIRNGAQAALLDLTSRQSNLRPIDAIKTQANVPMYLDLTMTRLGKLTVFPVDARNHAYALHNLSGGPTPRRCSRHSG